jgi:hypothetical protein
VLLFNTPIQALGTYCKTSVEDITVPKYCKGILKTELEMSQSENGNQLLNSNLQ